MSDNWKGEHLIRTPRASAPDEATAAVRAQYDTLRRAARAGLSEAQTVRTTGIPLGRIRAIKEVLGITFRDGRRTRRVEGGV